MSQLRCDAMRCKVEVLSAPKGEGVSTAAWVGVIGGGVVG